MDGARTQRERILLVDDEPNILATTQAILQVEGYEADTAGSGEEALQMMKLVNYDLLIVDLNMYGMNGLELLEHTNSLFPQPLTIVLTGYASLESAIKALHLGAYDYLIKPCSVFDLKYSVKRALEHRRLSETEALLQVSRSINSSFDQEEILNTVACTAANMLGLERGIIALFEDSENNRKCISTVPCEGEPLGGDLISQLYHDHTEVRSCLDAGFPFASSNVNEDSRISEEWKAAAAAKSLLAAPICARNKLFGILYIDSQTKQQGFSSAALRLAQGLADQAATALENARLYNEVVAKNTELAKLNERLKKLDQLKSNFLNIATHELRTPISIVLGYNTMLQEELSAQLNADQHDMLNEAINNCQRLINLVNSMLDISRIEAGKLDINIMPNDIRSCIDSALRLLRERARAKQIELDVEIAPCLPLVPFDNDRLQQVFINLIDNAIKYTRVGGKITVGAVVTKESRIAVPSNAATAEVALEAPIAAASDAVLEISVSDTGAGIPAKDLHLVFDEFEQSSNQEEGDKLPSSGLGLAIAKKIISAHEGKIWVESKVNVGSKFIFQLPLASSRAQHSEPPVTTIKNSPRTKRRASANRN